MIAHLDCSTGISGDKLLGALVDAGFPLERLAEALRGMGLGAVTVTSARERSHGVSATGISVTEPGAPRRHWREIRALLDGAPLAGPVRTGALAAFAALAEAEAAVHGCTVGDVHFHEIGAADTIADIVGVALGLHELGIKRLECSPVAVGSGTVATEHGVMPVPAPATALLLAGVPVVAGPAAGELTTPTGAALLRAHAAAYGAIPAITLRRVGTGCGTRDIGTPNVCRLLMGEEAVHDPSHDETVVLETNIDHLTPEELATAADRLRAAGALDVWQTPIVMKKGRAAVMLSVLSDAGGAAGLAERIIAETGTLGVRILTAERRVVERDVAEIETSLGRARFKIATLPDGTRTLRVESDDAMAIAAARGEAVDVAARALEAEAARITGVPPLRRQPQGEVGGHSG